MKIKTRVLFLGALLASNLPSTAHAEEANPLAKVVSLVNGLRAKVKADGEKEDRSYHEFYEWCDEASKFGQQAVKTHSSKQDKFDAQIEDLTSAIDAANTKIEELGAKVSSSGKELKEASAIREQEASQFVEAEQQLVETIDSLSRALGVLEKEMAKHAAALAQVDISSMGGLLQALGVLVDSAAISADDNRQLIALAQSQQRSESDDDDDDDDASDKPKSGNILDVLEELKDKADKELAGIRKTEGTAQFNFKMFKSSIEHETKTNARHLEEEKTAKAEAEEKKASIVGDLDVTVASLKTADKELASVRESCMTTAADHQASLASRAAEMKVLSEVLKILQESTGGAASFAQISSTSKEEVARRDARLKIARLVRRLAKKHHSAALVQLASHIAAVFRYGAGPFAKVKGLLTDMIAKLEKEGEAAATEKAWCDEQMQKTGVKHTELGDDIEKVTVKIEEAMAKSAQLKSEVKHVQAGLAALAKEQVDIDRIRRDGNAVYQESKTDLEASLTGVRKALDMLRSYYGSGAASFAQESASSGSLLDQPAPPQSHEASSGAGGGIIDILEVCESDFADNLAKVESEEADEVDEYKKICFENRITKQSMEQDVKYKTMEFTGLDKKIDELSADGESAKAEMTSVTQYFDEIKDRCIAKPEPFEEKTARRQAEIDGLKEALTILDQQSSLLQSRRIRRHDAF